MGARALPRAQVSQNQRIDHHRMDSTELCGVRTCRATPRQTAFPTGTYQRTNSYVAPIFISHFGVRLCFAKAADSAASEARRGPERVRQAGVPSARRDRVRMLHKGSVALSARNEPQFDLPVVP
jgi:hypothetical protein